MSKEITATICIPTFNAEEFLEDLLKSVFRQKTSFNYEVLVIDSGSKDSTLKIIENFPKVKLHTIKNSEFGHGKTRNLGAKIAKGEFIVYLTQDAVPAHKYWLEYMIEPFYLNDMVFSVFGKQVPRANCIVSVKREVATVFRDLGPDHSLMVHRGKLLSTKVTFPAELTFLSNANSAVRKDYLLNKIKFKDVDYSEDQALGIDILKAGYLKVYTPFGSVLHSHDYKLKKYFQRKYDEFVGVQEGTGIKHGKVSFVFTLKEILKSTLQDFKFIKRDREYSLKRKLYNVFYSPLYNIQRERARRLAVKERSNKSKYSLESKQRKLS